MTLFLDTSALVKLYVVEAESVDVIEAVDRAERLALCVVAYPEARAALARRQREGQLKPDDLRTAVTALDGDWSTYTRLEVDDALARLAGVLAEQHALRGFDAVHLAAALTLNQQRHDVTFISFDARLNEAAKAHLKVL